MAAGLWFILLWLSRYGELAVALCEDPLITAHEFIHRSNMPYGAVSRGSRGGPWPITGAATLGAGNSPVRVFGVPQSIPD